MDMAHQSPELTLLLTVARILRARCASDIYGAQDEDFETLNEALAPFEPCPTQTISKQDEV